MNEVRDYFRRVQLKPAVVNGHVSAVELDAATGQQMYATVNVGGSSVRVRATAAPPLALGDQVRLTQSGFAASAEYEFAGLEAGGRPASGIIPVLFDGATIGAGSYYGGDLIMGKLSGGNTYHEYATGRTYHRVGLEVYGIEYPDGSQLYGHATLDGGDYVPDGANVYITPTAVELREGTEDTIRLSAGKAYLEKALQIGGSTSRLVMSQIMDVVAGLPVETEIYGIRLYDASGLPRISLLTSTPNSDSAAMLLGAETDTNYMWFQDGELRLKGHAEIESGTIGKMEIDDNIIRSQNSKVALYAEADEEHAEGLALWCSDAANTGTVRWIDPDRDDWNLGIIFAAEDPATSGYQMYYHITTPYGVEPAAPTKHTWVAGGWNRTLATLSYDYNGNLTGVETLEARGLSGLSWQYKLGANLWPTVTNMGSVISVGDYTNYDGIHAKVLSAGDGAEIPLQIPVNAIPGYVDGTAYITRLVLNWEKRTSSTPYLAEIFLAEQNISGSTKTKLYTISNVGYGTAPARYATTLVDALGIGDYVFAVDFGKLYYLVIKPSVSASDEIRLHSVEVDMCDKRTRDLNQWTDYA